MNEENTLQEIKKELQDIHSILELLRKLIEVITAVVIAETFGCRKKSDAEKETTFQEVYQACHQYLKE